MNRLLQTLLLLSLLACQLLHGRVYGSPLECPTDNQINAEFENGASWHMCWQSRSRENLVLSDVHYRPPGKETFKIFSSLGLAQLHVSYDDLNIVYNDVTQFGLGGDLVKLLTDDDCPAGYLLSIGDKPGVCVSVSDTIDHYQSLHGTNYSQSLSVVSTSLVGAYAYIVTWKFFADGSIQPSIGAAGALQRSTDDPDSPYGRELDGVSDKSWLSHTHNYYWKLDFDLGESALDDEVSEFAFITDADGRRARASVSLEREAARVINPQQMTSWLISDDNRPSSAGYLIEPVNYGHKLAELMASPYTGYDFFVTKQKDCERFASENAIYFQDCGSDVLEFVNDEPLKGEDIVLWHRISFHHVPRNEDRYVMHSHWDGFTMEARNLTGNDLPDQEDLPDITLAAMRVASEQRVLLNAEANSGGAGSVAWSVELLLMLLLFVPVYRTYAHYIFTEIRHRQTQMTRPTEN